MEDTRLVYLFGNYELLYPDLQYLNYVTPEIVRKSICEITNHWKNLTDLVIWDMFAGIGTDSIEFAKYAGKVISTEVSADTYEHLVKNTKDTKDREKDREKITPVLHDCSTLEYISNVDLIYFDPPWGDSYLNSAKAFDFSTVVLANGTNVMDLFNTLLKKNIPMIVKSPINCDTFIHASALRIAKILVYSQQKLKFILINSV